MAPAISDVLLNGSFLYTTKHIDGTRVLAPYAQHLIHAESNAVAAAPSESIVHGPTYNVQYLPENDVKIVPPRRRR